MLNAIVAVTCGVVIFCGGIYIRKNVDYLQIPFTNTVLMKSGN